MFVNALTHLNAEDCATQAAVVPCVRLHLGGHSTDDSFGLDGVLKVECSHQTIPSWDRYIMLNLLRRLMGFSREEIEALATPRSPGWRILRREHLLENPRCIVCGSTKNVVPHHVVPFHIDPSRELDPANLVTLCESPTFNCHLFFGHLKRWDRHNPHVVEDAAKWRLRISEADL